MGDLIEFYGQECKTCREIMPLVERLEEELGLEIERLEVWHNYKNAELFKEMDKGRCGSVPFFYNRKTGKWLCGEVGYEKLLAWAKGE